MRSAIVRSLFLVSGLLCALGHAAAAAPPLPPDACPAGAAATPVTIEVFSDFQCPACADFYRGNLRQILAGYVATRRVCVLLQEFPLPRHEHARSAAAHAAAALRVSPAVHLKVVDALYSNQQRWSADGDVEAVLAEVLTDEESSRLAAWLGKPEVEAEIRRDVADGGRRGVRSTPTIFLHARGATRRIPSTVQWEILRRYLDFVLSSAEQR